MTAQDQPATTLLSLIRHIVAREQRVNKGGRVAGPFARVNSVAIEIVDEH